MKRSSPVGQIHSIETCALHEGPGVRTAFFMQGCPLRCLYCHNPDTWSKSKTTATSMSLDELMAVIIRQKPYMGRRGGVTFTGGEPLLQGDFLKAVLLRCKAEGIHTALDTSGYGPNWDNAVDVAVLSEILSLVDLVILDVKHVTDDGYKKMTGRGIEGLQRFMTFLTRYHGIQIWVRHVQVPGLTAFSDIQLGVENLASLLGAVKLEWLPYHELGVHKYKALAIQYPLEGWLQGL